MSTASDDAHPDVSRRQISIESSNLKSNSDSVVAPLPLACDVRNQPPAHVVRVSSETDSVASGLSIVHHNVGAPREHQEASDDQENSTFSTVLNNDIRSSVSAPASTGVGSSATSSSTEGSTVVGMVGLAPSVRSRDGNQKVVRKVGRFTVVKNDGTTSASAAPAGNAISISTAESSSAATSPTSAESLPEGHHKRTASTASTGTPNRERSSSGGGSVASNISSTPSASAVCVSAASSACTKPAASQGQHAGTQPSQQQHQQAQQHQTFDGTSAPVVKRKGRFFVTNVKDPVAVAIAPQVAVVVPEQTNPGFTQSHLSNGPRMDREDATNGTHLGAVTSAALLPPHQLEASSPHQGDYLITPTDSAGGKEIVSQQHHAQQKGQQQHASPVTPHQRGTIESTNSPAPSNLAVPSMSDDARQDEALRLAAKQRLNSTMRGRVVPLIATTTTAQQHVGLGKVMYFLDQMRSEVCEADKNIKNLQSGTKFLVCRKDECCVGSFLTNAMSLLRQRDKNKELEARVREMERKYTEEKNLREAAESKLKALRRKIKAQQPKDQGNDTDHSKEELGSDRGSIVRKNSEDMDPLVGVGIDLAASGSQDTAGGGSVDQEKRIFRPHSPETNSAGDLAAPTHSDVATPDHSASEMKLPPSIASMRMGSSTPATMGRRSSNGSNGSAMMPPKPEGHARRKSGGSQPHPSPSTQGKTLIRSRTGGDQQQQAPPLGIRHRNLSSDSVPVFQQPQMPSVAPQQFDPHAPASSMGFMDPTMVSGVSPSIAMMAPAPMFLMNQNAMAVPVLGFSGQHGDTSVNEAGSYTNQPMMHALHQQSISSGMTQQQQIANAQFLRDTSQQQPVIQTTGSFHDLQQPVILVPQQHFQQQAVPGCAEATDASTSQPSQHQQWGQNAVWTQVQPGNSVLLQSNSGTQMQGNNGVHVQQASNSQMHPMKNAQQPQSGSASNSSALHAQSQAATGPNSSQPPVVDPFDDIVTRPHNQARSG